MTKKQWFVFFPLSLSHSFRFYPFFLRAAWRGNTRFSKHLTNKRNRYSSVLITFFDSIYNFSSVILFSFLILSLSIKRLFGYEVWPIRYSDWMAYVICRHVKCVDVPHDDKLYDPLYFRWAAYSFFLTFSLSLYAVRVFSFVFFLDFTVQVGSCDSFSFDSIRQHIKIDSIIFH